MTTDKTDAAPTTDGVDRRAVLYGAAAIAAAAATGTYVVRRGISSPTTASAQPRATRQPQPDEGSSDTVLAAAADVPRDGGLVLEKEKIVLTRGADDVVRGFSATCTHQGCLVASVAQGTINCPCHGSRFDITSGAVVGGPAPRALPPVAVTQRGNRIVKA